MNIFLDDKYYLTRVQSLVDQKKDEKNNLDRLDARLRNAGYPNRGAYSIGQSNLDDCLLIEAKDGFWSVCYVERGVKFSPSFFFDLDDAIAFFLWKLTHGEITSN